MTFIELYKWSEANPIGQCCKCGSMGNTIILVYGEPRLVCTECCIKRLHCLKNRPGEAYAVRVAYKKDKYWVWDHILTVHPPYGVYKGEHDKAQEMVEKCKDLPELKIKEVSYG